ncbi:MAG TPA: hypothetical protein VF463_10390 [Sphingobium sp.]
MRLLLRIGQPHGLFGDQRQYLADLQSIGGIAAALDQFDIKTLAAHPAFWATAAQTAMAKQSIWPQEMVSPSGLVRTKACGSTVFFPAHFSAPS